MGYSENYSIVVLGVIVNVERMIETGISYNELSKASGFSLPHLRAVFSNVMGESLARYVLGRRISRAAFDIIHTDGNILDIAHRYGFTNPDTFTRAFKRVTGLIPKDFRTIRPAVKKVKLGAGLFGVSVKNVNDDEGAYYMNSNDQKHISDGSVILYGVPKVAYGAFGGCTPFPIALKAVANYIGEDAAYEDAMVISGAAFRLVWDTTCWNCGNVDVILGFEDPVTVFRSGIESLGREFKILSRKETTAKDEFISFIKEQIDKGVPVIALGIVGPPEACVITGYRDGGQTLLGWNCFQDSPEFSGGTQIDESGYFVTSSWWENEDTIAVMSFGEKTGQPETVRDIVKRGILGLEGRTAGNFAKGVLAYDAWKKAILDETQFGPDLIMPLQAERLMCQGDGADCVADGRSNASKYFNKLAEKHPEETLYKRIADQFAISAAGAGKMFETLGGWERGEAQIKAFMKSDVRIKIGEIIGECKAADEKALELMKEFASR